MSDEDAQKSEVHATTANASTAPTAEGEAETTRAKRNEHAPSAQPRDLPGIKGGARVIEDQTDAGGPLVVETDDPDMQTLDLPKDEFPTERKPEIDPPVK
jgi:hypothetical protein